MAISALFAFLRKKLQRTCNLMIQIKWCWFKIQKYSYLAKLWPKNGAHAHVWAYFFGHYSAIFGPIGLKFVKGAWETIIYRLMMRYSSYGASFSLLGRLLRENWRDHNAHPLRSGASKPDRKVGPQRRTPPV